MSWLRRLVDGHGWLREQLSAYLDGELGPAERARLEAHLQGCPACRAELDSLRRTVELVGRLPAVSPLRSFRLTSAMVREAGPRPALAGLRLLPAATALSALLLLVVLGADLALLSRPQPAAFPSEARREVRVESEVGIQAERAPAEEPAPAEEVPAAAPEAPADQPQAEPMALPTPAEEEAVTAPPEPAPPPTTPRLELTSWLRGVELGLLTLTVLLAALTLRRMRG